MLRQLSSKNADISSRANRVALRSTRVSSRSFTFQRRFTTRTEPSEYCNILRNIDKYTTENIVSVFASVSNNPYHNLAIENHILKYSNPQSSILFTYVNRPCVVFGRNQNPWLEINIAQAQQGLTWHAADWKDYVADDIVGGKTVPLDLVRRRSGGGTVIHDAGNLNFSFIVPNDKDFTRNKHAQIIVTALRACLQQTSDHGSDSKEFEQAAYFGHDDIYVNERHDIAMKVGGKAFKVSGSAFKLTKGRALHHGTLLLASPNIPSSHQKKALEGQNLFSRLLTSPAKPFLDAKGVGSVSSPVHNLFDVDGLSHIRDASWNRRRLIIAVRGAIVDTFISKKVQPSSSQPGISTVTVGDEVIASESLRVAKIKEDVQEMMMDAWRYGQTPSFSYSSSHEGTTIAFRAKQSKISDAKLENSAPSDVAKKTFSDLDGKLLHEVDSWQSYVPSAQPNRDAILEHLSRVFPNLSLADMVSSRIQSGNTIVQEGAIKDESGDSPPRNSNTIRHIPGQKEVDVEEPESNTLTHK